MSDAEFWRLTPRELQALHEARQEYERGHIEIQEYFAASIQAAIYNVNRSRSTDRILQPSDFMRIAAAAKRAESPIMTGEQMLAAIRRANRSLGGREE